MGDVILGLDAGSSVMKAAAFDLGGRLLATAARLVPLDRTRPGRVEVDPEATWTAACDALREVAGAGRPVALGLTGAMVGAWACDAGGRALHPGINWEDSRAQPLLEALEHERPGALLAAFRSSGCALQQGCTLPLLGLNVLL